MISKEDVLNLAQLARLKLSDEEVTLLQKDMSSILDYVGHVSAAQESVVGEKPLLRNVMRGDTPRVPDDPLAFKEEALRAAFPKREGNFNVVRKIIQKDE